MCLLDLCTEGMELVLQELFPMQHCITWPMNNTADGLLKPFLMCGGGQDLILWQDPLLEERLFFSLILLI